MASKTKQKFKLSNDQKAVLLAVIVVGGMLGGVVLYKRASFNFDPNKRAATVSTKESAEYEKLLEAIKPNKEASDQLLKQIVTEADVRTQIEDELQTSQKIVMPQVSNSEIKVARENNRDAVVAYIKQVAPLLSEFNKQTIPVAQGSFQDTVTIAEVGAAIARCDVYLAGIKNVPVPKDAIAFQKAQILVIESYKRLLQVGKDYRESKTDNPWPEVYKQYVIANTQVTTIVNEFEAIDKKYNIKNVALAPQNSALADAVSFFQIKQADAAAGIGDTVIVAANIPDAIKEGVKQGFASAYGKFATKYLGQLIAAVDKNYKISNFLYYSDALVRGQYANDYLKKYVTNPIDQEIIKRFIPQFACGAADNQQLKAIFKAKAQDYLGFDPNTIALSDPDFQVKMARVGEFLASDSGWEFYYSEQAQAAESQAQQAVTRELLSSGLKSPRDLVGQQIQASLNVIEGSQVAALITSLQLGSVNAENIISQLVAGVINQLVDKFVFNGVTFKEQTTCAAIPVETPIIPAGAVIYNATSSDTNTSAHEAGNTIDIRGNP